MPKLEILSQTPYSWIDKDRKLVQSTFVVYKDEAGRVGTVVVKKPKAEPADVEAELKKRAAGP